MMAVGSIGAGATKAASGAVMPILLAVSAGHLLNDTMQSVLLSIYPLIKGPLRLDFVHMKVSSPTTRVVIGPVWQGL